MKKFFGHNKSKTTKVSRDFTAPSSPEVRYSFATGSTSAANSSSLLLIASLVLGQPYLDPNPPEACYSYQSGPESTAPAFASSIHRALGCLLRTRASPQSAPASNARFPLIILWFSSTRRFATAFLKSYGSPSTSSVTGHDQHVCHIQSRGSPERSPATRQDAEERADPCTCCVGYSAVTRSPTRGYQQLQFAIKFRRLRCS